MNQDPFHDKYDPPDRAYQMHLNDMFPDSGSYAPSPEEIELKKRQISWLRNHGFGAHMVRLVAGDEIVTLAEVRMWYIEFGMSVTEIAIKYNATEDFEEDL